jgi:hypothetical protein
MESGDLMLVAGRLVASMVQGEAWLGDDAMPLLRHVFQSLARSHASNDGLCLITARDHQSQFERRSFYVDCFVH